MKKNVNFITAILMWLISYFYIDNTFNTYSLGFSITIFTTLIVGLSYWYIIEHGIEVSNESYWYMAYVLLIGLSYSIFSASGLRFIKMLVLLSSLGYWLLVVSNSRTSKVIDYNILKDLFMKIFIKPISKLHLLTVNLFFQVSIKDKKTKNIVYGLVIAFPILLVVVALLSSTDSTFNNLLNTFINLKFLENINIFYLVVSFLLASGFFSALFINTNEKENNNYKGFYLDKTIIKTILISFILVYVVYLISVSYTYLNYQVVDLKASQISSYAKSGFYELCAVSFINFILFIFSRWLVEEEDKNLKSLLCVIGIQTLIMIALAMLRLFVYIGIYGLTYLRFNALVFMVLLFITVILFIIGVYKNINYTKISVLIGSFVFLVLCYTNIGKLIISYNYHINNFNYYDYYSYGYESIPYLIKEYNESDNNEGIKNIIDNFKYDLNETRYINHTVESLNYLKMLEEMK
ncbi:MAG: DUF4173 domain-containing protein [Erysipelotrichaceae bacterium]|nr:DUF4173 domain-containing protein [Erysipelotrichaceae bacterium]